MRFVCSKLSVALLLATGAVLIAPNGAAGQAADPPKVVTPAFDFSGLILGNFQMRSDDATKTANGGKSTDKFDIERVYLTFRMPAGDHASIRVTTDVLNNTDGTTNGYYKGWTVRLKYAYAQFNLKNDMGGHKGMNLLARLGMLHTVLVDHEEGVWPRYLGQVAEERNGFFSSADLGAAVQLSLPNKLGEIYGTITNGPGYSAAENDRFKDLSLRLSLTPLASSKGTGVFKTFTISPWIYEGKTASKFAAGGAGQIGPITDGLSRNRFGVFVGNKDRRLTLGANYAQRTETTEGGSNTTAAPRTTLDITGKLTSAFVVLRPGAFKDQKSAASHWGLVGRLDNFKPDKEKGPANQFVTAGLFWDATSKITMSLDFQNQTQKNGSVTPESKIMFLHLSAAF